MSILKYVSDQYIDSFRARLGFELRDGVWHPPSQAPSRATARALSHDIHDLYQSHFNDMAHLVHTDGKEMVQGVGYGLVSDFRLFVNVGLLFSNRLILWDYAWGRLLKSSCDDVEVFKHLCEVVVNLLQIRDLSAIGGVCIFPHPANWSSHAQVCLAELQRKGKANTPANFGLVSALSVCDDLNIHPYTLYSSADSVPRVSGTDKNLLTQGKLDFMHNITRLVNDEPFSFIREIRPFDLHAYLQETPEFFQAFREAFVVEGPDKSDAERRQAFNARKAEVTNALKARNSKMRIQKQATAAQHIIHLGALATIVYGMASGTPTMPLYAGISALSASLAKHLADKAVKSEDNTLVLGFADLKRIADTPR